MVEDNGHNRDNRRDVIGQVWGILYLALGVLTLISLISHFAGSGSNLLGPYVGTALSRGMIYLCGRVPIFVFPGLCIYIGMKRIFCAPLNLRFIRFLLILWFEVCVLFAIHNIPITPEHSFHTNFIGNIAALLLQYVFGHHVFGPYFITLLGIVIVLLMFFRIDVVVVIQRVWQWLRHGWRIIAARGGSMLRHAAFWRGRTAGAEATETASSEAQADGESGEAPEQSPPGTASDAASGSDSAASGPAGENDEAQSVDDVPQCSDEAASGSSETVSETDPFRHGDSIPSDSISITPPEDAVSSAGQQSQSCGEPAGDEHGQGSASDEDYYKVPGQENNATGKKKAGKKYEIPKPSILSDPPAVSTEIDREALTQRSRILEKTLNDFNIEAKVVNVNPGPVITRYDMELAAGVKVSKVVSLQDDIALAVGGKRIRIQAPIPGKAAIGIELPNENRQTVYFKHVLTSDEYTKSNAKLPVVIGRTISGAPFVSDIKKMPHLLIAGQTGAGKSVCINSLICSLLMHKTPQQMRLILIDPKKVELSYYQDIPHLMSPVVTEPKEAVKALHWAQIEMDRRYRILAGVGARDIESFNQKIRTGKIRKDALSPEDNKELEYIVIIVDELADLMMTASKDVEAHVQRIAQLARAVGIHLIVATQRPSVDIITGPIKANLTSRIAFRTIQSTDSRTILGKVGSEKLLGLGDMLFLRSGAPDIERYHGAFISEEDVERIAEAIIAQQVEVEKIDNFEEAVGEGNEVTAAGAFDGEDGSGQRDEFFADAAQMVVSMGQGSTSFLQRRLKVGYARAGRIMDELERAGVVGPSEGSKSREVRMSQEELDEYLQQ